MLAYLSGIKDRLASSIDKNGSILDMDSAVDAISALEKTSVSKEELEATRLGRHVNNIRKASRNSPLAKRAKNLIKSWQQMIDKKETPFRNPRTRPETPNSVGSSPSPPEPPRDCLVYSHSSPLLAPRPGTPVTDRGTPKIRKTKNLSDSTKPNRKKEDAPNTGQIAVTNGFKASPKTMPSTRPSINQNPASSANDRSESPSVRTDGNRLSVPHKSHKRKRGHRSSPRDEQTPSPVDVNTKMKSSKSAPDFTVSGKSPAERLEDGKRTANTPPFGGGLKRRREDVDDSPDKTPKRAKERRLTYDPVTKQIKEVPGLGFAERRNAKDSPEKLLSKLALKDKSESSSAKVGAKQRLAKKTEVVRAEDKFSKSRPVAKSSLSKKDDDIVSDMPSKITPAVEILGSNRDNNFGNCDQACSSSDGTDFRNLYREFKKRKTRRKDDALITMTSLYPLSGLVESFESDSDDSSTFESGFSSTIETVRDSAPVGHSRHCRLPGVTGCRGDNGSWFDWAQTFCVRNHGGSERLPDETEIPPLHILPYVELD